jgi:hypothetical protein
MRSGESAPAPGPTTDRLTVFTVTVSGTVTGPDGPVPDVLIDVNNGQTGEGAVTDGSGFYSVTIWTAGTLHLHARPPLATRLVEVNMVRYGITGSFTHDFTTSPGNLLSLQPVDAAGQPLGRIDPEPLAFSLLTPTPPGHVPEYHLVWDWAAGRHECVVPPDLYRLGIDAQSGAYLPTTLIYDLRDGDQVVDLVFDREAHSHAISYPPAASKITVGSPDGLGEALVTGAPGAVVPTGHVLLTNLSSWHWVDAVSNADGSFSARIYAPAGSALYIQHGSLEWQARMESAPESFPVDIMPATLINLPHTHSAPPGATPFAAAGATWLSEDNYVEAAWAITGTLRPSADSGLGAGLSADRYAPGDSLRAEGALRIYGPAITSTTDVGGVSAGGWLFFVSLGNQEGVPLVPYNASMTTRLTVSGFPIRDSEVNAVGAECGYFEVSGLHLSGAHAIDGSFSVDCAVPGDLPPGTYRPAFALDITGVPASTEWPAPGAGTSYWNYRPHHAPLPPIVVAGADQEIAEVQYPWRLMMEDNSQGTRGAMAREDVGRVGFSSFIVAQGAPYVAPRLDSRTGTPIVYSLEPVLPRVTAVVATSTHSPVAPPIIPFDLPGGSLRVVILRPDGTTQDLGSEPFAQSALRARTPWGGYQLNQGSVRVDHGYSLVAGSDRFRVAFDQYGHHVITLTGVVSDIWGNRYPGGGTYDVWVAEPLDIATGVLPGTPFDVGDTFNPALQLYPAVPAMVTWVVTEYPDSDSAQAVRHTIGGWANRFGAFDGPGFAFGAPGEYRVDLVARYVDGSGAMWMGARTWGGVVTTPAAEAQLVAHGRRGTNNLVRIPNQWFVFCRDLETIPGQTPHSYAPYFNGDVIWSRLESTFECSGEALQTGGSVQDTVGVWETIIRERFERMHPPLDPPGDLDERLSAGEMPLISSTRSGRPPQMYPDEFDQIAYMYFYSERPGVRVREDVTEDYTFPAGYWRFDTLYDDQMGVGLLGDLPNDYKFQYIGAVFRDLDTGHSEYLGQGTGWVHLPEDDELGSRVMPPFAGPGNGGWTTEGGPLLRLKGRDVHMFILPTGTLPGAILHVGDTFQFAGHIMPTLPSQVAVTVTAASGTERTVDGQANRVGYFYDPDDDFVVDEPGLWSVDVRVWHDGQIGTGEPVYCDPGDPFNPALPCPSGDVLGSDGGRYWFYVVPADAPRLEVASPAPGRLSFDLGLTPIPITGTVPAELNGATIDYTIAMPGFILEQGRVTPTHGVYTVVFDPVSLHDNFPNLDLVGRDDYLPGLADTFAIGLLLRGQSGGETVYRANTVTIQGEQVFVGDAPSASPYAVYLPLVSGDGVTRSKHAPRPAVSEPDGRFRPRSGSGRRIWRKQGADPAVAAGDSKSRSGFHTRRL